MSEYRINQITNQAGTAGPQVAGITTFSSSSGLVMPSGNTSRRLFTDNITTDQLVLFLDVDNDQSFDSNLMKLSGPASFRDLSSFGNHATLSGFSSTQYTTKSGVNCFYMNGTAAGTGDIEIPLFYQNYIAGVGNANHSIEFWVYTTGYNIDVLNSGTCGSYCMAYFESGDYFDTSGGNGVGGGKIDGEWHQYGIIKRESYVKTFRDGKFASSEYDPAYKSSSPQIRSDWASPYGSSALNARIGSRGWANRTNDWYLGLIRFYRKSLTDEEILRNFNANRRRFGL